MFVEVANYLGRFLHVEDNLLREIDKRMGKILVEIDVDKRLDYWSIPFICTLCHNTGHLMKYLSGFQQQASFVDEGEASDSTR